MAKQVDNPNLAFRLARAIVSDIALYNQEKVREGIKNDTLFDLLKNELDEGGCRRRWRSAVTSTIGPSST
jgi:hypothetical protein